MSDYDRLDRMRDSLAYLDGVARCNLAHAGTTAAAAEAMVSEGLAHWVPNDSDPGNRDVDLLEWVD